ncbi:di-N-acetylchitobiase-like isoform X3 [Paramacrobiotus metropolitanus]|uniref:di-N-acetylchitobiase-like isoform X3 n=1 Tax=Paramacrobiotus metropolitanus TaxID=2943436 RepID=UPI00244575E1|nr:di-N-acetylchitobiase-like isoform X3 [Paramacrobiotus metropolitanus]
MLADKMDHPKLLITLTVVLSSLTAIAFGADISANVTRPCPCNNTAWCERIPASKHKKEVYGFADSTGMNPSVYKLYDWKVLTTLAMWNFTDELICLAHENGVKLHIVGEYPYEQLLNVTYRQQWISDIVKRLKHDFLDGINFDPEYPIAAGSPQRQALVDLVNETKMAFNRELPGAQVVFDTAWATYCVDERCYDYKGLADASDYLFVMAYCLQGQVWGPCIAMSNAPYFRLIDGIRGFFNLGIPPSKLVLGLPLFGYDYPCDKLGDDNVCELPKATYHGAPCSDLVGTQVGIDLIVGSLQPNSTKNLWNQPGQSPQFNYINATGGIRQVHYDNEYSLLMKYLWTVSNDLRGVGYWHIGYLSNLNGTDADNLRRKYWQTIPTESNWDSYAMTAINKLADQPKMETNFNSAPLSHNKASQIDAKV